MMKTQEQQRQHDEATADAIERLKAIGRKYGRGIMVAVLSGDGDVDQINAGLDAAVSDIREFLESNEICQANVETAVDVVRAAIIAEGKALAVMLPDSVGGVH